MREVKWVKITTDMFDNRKIKHLRRLPDGNNIVLIWIMLLTMAGRCNSGGKIFLTENIPYDAKMLADELDFKENTVAAALKNLEQLDMISVDNGFYTIVGWGEYQNVDGMDKVREQTRKRVAEFKKNKKSQVGNVTSNAEVSNNSTNELVVIAKVGGSTYKKNYVYLNDYTLYVVEDISGTHTDPYHYKVYFDVKSPDVEVK